ncbi:MAG: right-handed parallel beta-helix repeat-containing protein, partial [Planctomycetes bacterium]|nr:right-handed parallel beta-helix repeat-containing protein [Planctomycetota bacterium]
MTTILPCKPTSQADGSELLARNPARWCVFTILVAVLAAPAVGAACVENRAQLLKATDRAVKVCGDIVLQRSDQIDTDLIYEGSAASGARLECNGATLGNGEDVFNLFVRSRKLPDGTWERPVGVTIEGCNIKGAVRIYGMGRTGEAPDVVASSYHSDHVARVRAAAPTWTTFRDVTITGMGPIPLYLSPGVSFTRFTGGEIDGRTDSVNIYIGAESYFNIVRDSDIHAQTSKRELIAIDASSHNKLINNDFSALNHGGIFLYRNCGEGGGIRHTTPSHNQIINNSFYYRRYGDSSYYYRQNTSNPLAFRKVSGLKPAVYLGSRNGNRRYCDEDRDGDYGSAISDRDYAQYNVVAMNQIYKFSPDWMIWNGSNSTDVPNFIFANETVTGIADRPAGCFDPAAFGSPWRADGQTLDVVSGTRGSPRCLRLRCYDGELWAQGNCRMTPSEWECRATGSNDGCAGPISCPSGKTIIGAVGACNLEYGSVSEAAFNDVPIGWVDVVRASDHVSDGRCTVGSTRLSWGSERILAQTPWTRNALAPPTASTRSTAVA